MVDQLNDITQWHEIWLDIQNQQPKQLESKTFRKSNFVVIFWIIIFLFFGAVLITWLADPKTFNTDWGTAAIWFLSILEVIFAFKILWAYLTTLTVWEDSIVYKKWVLFRRKTEIAYIQISKVESSSFLWVWSIEITQLNNSFSKFKHVKQYDEAESLINEHVKQNKIVVQVS